MKADITDSRIRGKRYRAALSIPVLLPLPPVLFFLFFVLVFVVTVIGSALFYSEGRIAYAASRPSEQNPAVSTVPSLAVGPCAQRMTLIVHWSEAGNRGLRRRGPEDSKSHSLAWAVAGAHRRLGSTVDGSSASVSESLRRMPFHRDGDLAGPHARAMAGEHHLHDSARRQSHRRRICFHPGVLSRAVRADFARRPWRHAASWRTEPRRRVFARPRG